jgi:predicted aconitase with swiveling domain
MKAAGQFPIHGRPLISGDADALVVFTAEPLSFWGGYNARTGDVIDRHHELYGQNVAGKVFALPGGRGSSTGSGILLESIRLGTAPAAMILSRADPILALGAIVARELYGRVMPLLVVSEADMTALRDAGRVKIEMDGTIQLERAAPRSPREENSQPPGAEVK